MWSIYEKNLAEYIYGSKKGRQAGICQNIIQISVTNQMKLEYSRSSYFDALQYGCVLYDIHIENSIYIINLMNSQNLSIEF